MSDCDHMCTKCDRKPCIEFKPKMAVPRELQTDYEMMITANLLMTASIESFKRKNDKLQAENAKLREYGKLLHDHIKECCDYCGECGTCDVDALTRELGIEVDK